MINSDTKPDLYQLSLSKIYELIHKKYTNKFDSLNDLLDDSFMKFGDRIAISDDEADITYAQLDNFSRRVAVYLRKNCPNEKYIFVKVLRDWRTIGIIIGIIRAGAAYVPIQRNLPKKRYDAITELTGSDLVLSSDMEFPDTDDSANTEIDCDKCAYVLFTSGSTGKPKGVKISHKSVADTMQTMTRIFGLNEYDRVLGMAELTFDLSVFDVFGTLSSGASLIILKDNRNPALIHSIIKNKNVTTINAVPSIVKMIIEYNSPENLYSLRTIAMGGDVVSQKTVDMILDSLPYANVHITGGPTEIGVYSNEYLYKTNKQDYVPYGLPIDNKTMYIMKNGKLVIEEEGEIITGGNIGIGYIGDEELTKKKYVRYAHNKLLGTVFKTGDIGMLTKDGVLVIKGRIDNQVKVNGFRIELEEIENCLNKIDGVNQSIVGVRRNNNISKIIAGVKLEKEITVEQIKKELSALIPDYSMPHTITILDSIPLSDNNKLDRKKFIKSLI